MLWLTVIADVLELDVVTEETYSPLFLWVLVKFVIPELSWNTSKEAELVFEALRFSCVWTLNPNVEISLTILLSSNSVMFKREFEMVPYAIELAGNTYLKSL